MAKLLFPSKSALQICLSVFTEAMVVLTPLKKQVIKSSIDVLHMGTWFVCWVLVILRSQFQIRDWFLPCARQLPGVILKHIEHRRLVDLTCKSAVPAAWGSILASISTGPGLPTGPQAVKKLPPPQVSFPSWNFCSTFSLCQKIPHLIICYLGSLSQVVYSPVLST